MESVKIVYVLDDELPTLRCMIRTSCWLRYSCAELYLAFYCDFIIIPFLCADPSRHNMPPADYYVRRSHSLCPFRRIVSRRTEYRMFIALLCCTAITTTIKSGAWFCSAFADRAALWRKHRDPWRNRIGAFQGS